MTYEELLELEEAMGNVKVSYSRAQIESIPICTLSEDEDDPCTICQIELSAGEIVKRLPKCGHFYHIECIDEWLDGKKKCALCLQEVFD
jgi:hypothetical protein